MHEIAPESLFGPEHKELRNSLNKVDAPEFELNSVWIQIFKSG